MTDLDQDQVHHAPLSDARLAAAASKADLSASRRLALRTGVAPAAALRTILEARAGAAGLPALLAAREVEAGRETARLEARRQAQAARQTEAQARRLARHAGEPTPWRAWFDGSARPNPGRCAIGALLRGPAGEAIELSRCAGYGNSSEAEYLALIAVLETALAHGARELTVYGDSQVVIGDAAGPPDAGAAALAPYRSRAQALLAQLPGARLRWVPRHRNVEADALSQRAGSLAAPAPEPAGAPEHEQPGAHA